MRFVRLLQHSHCRLEFGAHFIVRPTPCAIALPGVELLEAAARQSLHMGVDRAEEAAACFVFRVAAASAR